MKSDCFVLFVALGAAELLVAQPAVPVSASRFESDVATGRLRRPPPPALQSPSGITTATRPIHRRLRPHPGLGQKPGPQGDAVSHVALYFGVDEDTALVGISWKIEPEAKTVEGIGGKRQSGLRFDRQEPYRTVL